MILLQILEELRYLKEVAATGPGTAHITDLEGDDPIRLCVGKRVEQDVLDHAEHSRGGTDAKRQCQHREAGKRRLTAEAAQSVPDVLPDSLHVALDGGCTDVVWRRRPLAVTSFRPHSELDIPGSKAEFRS
jgi:hypothetical protein